MNKDKKIELIRKKSERLTKQVEDLKERLLSEQESHDIEMESFKKRYLDNTKQTQDIISELEIIQDEWKNVVLELEKKSKEYEELIHSVKEVKLILIETGLKMKMPFSKKIKLFLKKTK